MWGNGYNRNRTPFSISTLEKGREQLWQKSGPFGHLRYNLEQAGSIQELTCPPYDIISEEQRREYLSRNGCNIIRLELPKEGENPYEEAARTLRAWREEGILQLDMDPGVLPL